MKRYAALAIAALLSAGVQAQTPSQHDTSPHKVEFITVDTDVRLEVLDWGGTGRPLVFLAGLGDTGHAFDQLALEFVNSNHVYAITRRGFGKSSKPAPTKENYSTARLGKDVIEVIDRLGLKAPIFAGHSLAGEELSWIGINDSNKISGLIYLDAGYSYAYYSPGNSLPLGTNLSLSGNDLDKELRKLRNPGVVGNGRAVNALANEIKEALSDFEKDLSAAQRQLAIFPPPAAPKQSSKTLEDKISDAILSAPQKFTEIRVPILALFADPPEAPPNFNFDPKIVEAESTRWNDQVNAFAAGMPSAHVVKIPNASHDLWRTNKADVVREMKAFMTTLH